MTCLVALRVDAHTGRVVGTISETSAAAVRPAKTGRSIRVCRADAGQTHVCRETTIAPLDVPTTPVRNEDNRHVHPARSVVRAEAAWRDDTPRPLPSSASAVAGVREDIKQWQAR